MLAFIVGLAWIRLLVYMKASRTFGPLINIIIKMFKDIAIFSVIFLVMFISFWAAASVLLAQIQDFKSNDRIVQSLFWYLLGNFDFSIKSELYKDNWLLPAFVIVFMVIMMILFVNLLVALMSDTFAIFST